MPTSKGWLSASAVLALAACEGGRPSLPDLPGLPVSRNAPSEVTLSDGMVVAGSNGWCVDRGTSRLRGETRVVVMGSCAALNRNADSGQPVIPGVVTVSVDTSVGGVPPLDDLEALFATENGRALLANDGQEASVRILESERADDHLILHVEDRSGGLPGAAAETWRALLDVNGRFVTISLVGFANRPISRDDGLATLRAQADRLISANAG